MAEGFAEVVGEITILLSEEMTKIQKLYVDDCAVEENVYGEAVTLDREMDCFRGCFMSKSKKLADARLFRCNLI